MTNSIRIGLASLLVVVGVTAIVVKSRIRQGRSIPGAVHDLGSVFAAQTPRIIHEFDVVNTTGRDVQVFDERHSCSCAAVSLSDRRLPAGGRTSLRVTINTPQTLSTLAVVCVLTTDHPDYPEWIYELRLQTYPTVRLVPDRIDLGSFVRYTAQHPLDPHPGPEPKTAKLETYAKRQDELPVPVGIECPPGIRLDISRQPIVTNLASDVVRAVYDVTAVIDEAESMPGEFARPMSILMEGSRPATAMVVWSVSAPLVVDPGQLNFGYIVPGGKSITVQASVRSVDGLPFLLSRPEEQDGHSLQVSCSSFETFAYEHKLVVSLSVDASSANARALAGELRLRTHLVAFPELRIPWSAFLRRDQATEHSYFDEKEKPCTRESCDYL